MRKSEGKESVEKSHGNPEKRFQNLAEAEMSGERTSLSSLAAEPARFEGVCSECIGRSQNQLFCEI